jgi:hypothetical protein
MEFAQATKIMDEGRTLSEQESQQLEVRLDSDPSDVYTRIKLLGYYRAHCHARSSSYVAQLAWIINNHPDSEIAHFAVFCSLNGINYKRVRSHWLESLNSHSASARAISNAIQFFLVNQDFETAFACLPTLKDAEVDEGDFLSLVMVYELLGSNASTSKAPSKESLLNEAIYWCQQAAQPESESGQLFASIHLVKLLFAAGRLDQAKDAANMILMKASDNVFTHGYAVNVCNIVLGKIALIEGSPTSAAANLLASVEVSDTDLLLSKAPDMSLAQALFDSGDIATVSSFLDRCSQLGFSKGWQTTLDRWREAIEDGREPPRVS